MKTVATAAVYLMLIGPLTLGILTGSVIFLEISFGISPPLGLAASCFALAVIFAVIYSIVWKIGGGSGPLNWGRRASKKRLLRVEFLQPRRGNV